jgi:threonine/homoserine/homoserine lactone efflux protein
MFRFADKFDYFMMIAGSLGGLALGVCTPLFILFWGQFTNVFGQSVDQIVEESLKELIKFIYLGIGTLFVGWVMIACWLITGERQAAACRKAYFATLLKQ